MKIYNSLEYTPEKKCVALGFFDGVHKGHQAVINHVINYSKKNNLVPTVLTFDKNPKSVISNNYVLELTDINTKQKILESMGIKNLYIINFEQIKDLSPEEFVCNILFNKLNSKCVTCGFNYYFGKNKAADAYLLKKICKNYNIKTKIISPVLYKNLPISSTRIRKNINNIKNIKEINYMLKRSFV